MSKKLSLRFQVLKRDNNTCQYCGSRPPFAVLEVDHKIPRSRGGTDDLDNLVTSCFNCNRGKRDNLLTDSTQTQQNSASHAEFSGPASPYYYRELPPARNLEIKKGFWTNEYHGESIPEYSEPLRLTASILCWSCGKMLLNNVDKNNGHCAGCGKKPSLAAPEPIHNKFEAILDSSSCNKIAEPPKGKKPNLATPEPTHNQCEVIVDSSNAITAPPKSVIKKIRHPLPPNWTPAGTPTPLFSGKDLKALAIVIGILLGLFFSVQLLRLWL